MAARQDCPYRNCKILLEDGRCPDGDDHNPRFPNPGLYDKCQIKGISRIIWRCPKCHNANQVLAPFCRACGYQLQDDRRPARGLLGNWTQPAASPATPDVLSVPQMAAAGDLIISFHGTEFVLSYAANGGKSNSVPFPTGPSLSASPVVIKERIYFLAPGVLWECSLTSGANKRISIPEFNPSPSGRPISVSQEGIDYIVAGGQSSILVLDTRSPNYEHKVLPVRLETDDSLLGPVFRPQWGVLFTTALGRICRVQIQSSPFEAETSFPRITGLEDFYLSAPSYCPATDTIYAECVSQRDLERSFLRFSPAQKGKPLKRLKIPTVSERYTSKDELRVLRFPLHVSGDFAIARSLVAPEVVHFISPSCIQTIQIAGLDMDPIWVTVGRGKFFSVKNNKIQHFKDAAVHQPADTIPAALGGGGGVVNRPLYHLGRLFIQEEKQLVALEV